MLLAGAEKVSVNSLAVQNPDIITQGARAFGRQCVVLGMDAKKTGKPGLPSGYEVFIQGGRKAMGLDAVEWARKARVPGGRRDLRQLHRRRRHQGRIRAGP